MKKPPIRAAHLGGVGELNDVPLEGDGARDRCDTHEDAKGKAAEVVGTVPRSGVDGALAS